jgi:hypothetical protein
VNASRQLHLNIKSKCNLPPCLPPFARAPSQSVTNTVSARLHGEGKGADEAHGVAWEQAGLVQGTDLRITCTFSQDPGQA